MVALPMQHTSNLIRAVSPVSAVVIIVSAVVKVNPLMVVKRTAVPLLSGFVAVLIISLIRCLFSSHNAQKTREPPSKRPGFFASLCLVCAKAFDSGIEDPHAENVALRRALKLHLPARSSGRLRHNCEPEAGAGSRPLSPLEILFWFLIPAGLLIWLFLNPPHALDLSLQRLIWKNFDGEWFNTDQTEFWLHKLPKFASIAAYALLLLALIRSFVRERTSPSAANAWDRLMRGRILYALLAGALCVLAVWWLKKTTGVSCPWSIAEFGGSAEITNPTLSLGFRPGVCWPSGAAGSGFCLLPVFFMLRGFPRKLSVLALAAAIILGLTAGIGRMLAGAHFLSHVVDAFLIDWLISAALYALFFYRRGFASAVLRVLRGSERTGSTIGAGFTGKESFRPGFPLLLLGLGLWWAFVFDAPMLMKLLAPQGTATLSSIALALSSGIAFAFVGAGLAALLSLLPRAIFRTLLVLLNVLGALSFAAAFLYGTAMTPDMVRNFLATDPAESAGYLGARPVFVFLWVLIPPLWLSLRG